MHNDRENIAPDCKQDLHIKAASDLFELVFNMNPDAAQITRLTDGCVTHVNDGYTRMCGFLREEAIGKRTLDIDLWEHPADRQNIIDELTRNGFCSNYEAIFKRKDGSKFVGLLSAKIFSYQDTPHVITVTRDITEKRQIERDRDRLIADLQKALSEIKTLQGILPICSYCKKIRDDKGAWTQMESYISKHTNALFSHGLCHECLEKHLPGIIKEEGRMSEE